MRSKPICQYFTQNEFLDMILIPALFKTALSFWLLSSSIVSVGSTPSFSSCAGLRSTGLSGSRDSPCWQTTSHRSKTQNSTWTTLARGVSSESAALSTAEATKHNALGALIALVAENEAAIWRRATSDVTSHSLTNTGTPTFHTSSGYSVFRAVPASSVGASGGEINTLKSPVTNLTGQLYHVMLTVS